MLREENDMRKAQQAVSNKASKEIEEFAQFQEVCENSFCHSYFGAYIVLLLD